MEEGADMIEIINSVSNELEPLQTLEKGKVTIYLCGPTVYNYIHVGNARNVVFFDTVARFLSFSGYEVNFASNITDVDDKIIERARAEGKSEKELTTFYANAFLTDAEMLGVSDKITRLYATDHIGAMITLIEDLISRDAAYVVDGTVFFAIDKMPQYGVLSHQSIEHLLVGARIEQNEAKRSPLDFVLWKSTHEGINWDSPWGRGRPGWHTECIALIRQHFGGPIDIHGGGMDLKFPHHENEIAQAKALGWPQLATYWLHNGFVELDDEKMAKSLGNFVLLKDALEKYGPAALRYWLLSVQYRQPLMFSEAILLEAKHITTKMRQTYEQAYTQLKLHKYVVNGTISSERVIEQQEQFLRALRTDFNTANAITVLHEVIKQVNIHTRQGEKSFSVLVQYLSLLARMDELLVLQIVNEPMITDEDIALYEAWGVAKKEKDFNTADALRATLADKGIAVR
jgi:cysteinyl-tRNA synthetase